MKTSILRDLVILLGIFGLIWIVVTLFPIFPEKPVLLSVEREQELGRQYYKLVQTDPQFAELEDSLLQSAIDQIGERLVSALPDERFTYHFIVFDNPMINAFTLPGGYILVSRGIIAFSESPDELAAVIAHEMGHVEKRHVVSRLIREMGLEILSSGDVYVAGEITRMLTSAGFDRKQEESADHFACELLEKGGIEPRSLSSLFRRMKEQENNELLEKFEMVSSHPNFNSRIKAVLSYEPGHDFEARAFDLDWEKVREEAGKE